MNAPDILSGLRILIVEDEMLVALLVEDTLTNYAGTVIGVAASVKAAMDIVATQQIDAAVMDVNIAGEVAYPVAEYLDAHAIPFIFVSGYGQSAVPANRPEWRVCAKPFRGEDMVAMLNAQVMRKRA